MPEHQQRESGSPFANAIPHQVDRFNSLVPLFVPEVKWTMTSHSFGENPSVRSTLSTNVFVARCFNVVLFACCLPASRLANHRHGKRDLSFRLNSVANVRSTTNVRRRRIISIFFLFHFLARSFLVRAASSFSFRASKREVVVRWCYKWVPEHRETRTCVSKAQVAETHATTVRARTTTTQGAYHIHCG